MSKKRRASGSLKDPLEPLASPELTLAGIAPTVRHLPGGAVLFHRGAATFGIFRLAAGRIRLVRVTPDGALVTTHSVRPGELFAEASLFSDRYHCDAIADRDSEVLVYPKVDLARRLEDDPRALWAFAGELAHRVRGLRTRLELGQIRSAPQRVLQFLRLRCDRDGVLRLEETLKQVAEEVGLTHEALYRALARLEHEGMVERRPGEIRLCPDTRTPKGPR